MYKGAKIYKVASPLLTDKGNRCFACGRDNQTGLQLKDFFVKESIIYTEIELGDEYSGFPGVIHGGIQTTLLDEMMAWAIFVFEKKIGVTIDMNIKFKMPVSSNHKYRVSAGLSGRSGRVLQLISGIYDDNDVYTEGEATYRVFSHDKARKVFGDKVDTSLFNADLI